MSDNGGRGCGCNGGNSALPLLGLMLLFMRLVEGVGDDVDCCCCVMAIMEEEEGGGLLY